MIAVPRDKPGRALDDVRNRIAQVEAHVLRLERAARTIQDLDVAEPEQLEAVDVAASAIAAQLTDAHRDVRLFTAIAETLARLEPAEVDHA